MRKFIMLMAAVFITVTATASALPYDVSADAKANVQQALTQARASHVPVLIIFGANWCEDCRALDRALKSDKNAALMAHSFKVVKVDVGNFDHNLDLSASYGNPIQKGIPAAVVVSPGNQMLYATKAGELADARRMSETGIYDFFEHVSQTAVLPR
jgi:thioredoxin 1